MIEVRVDDLIVFVARMFDFVRLFPFVDLRFLPGPDTSLDRAHIAAQTSNWIDLSDSFPLETQASGLASFRLSRDFSEGNR